MTQTKRQFTSIEEYLDGTNTRYERVIVLQLEANQYAEVGEFRDNDRVISSMFPELQVTAKEVLRAGR